MNYLQLYKDALSAVLSVMHEDGLEVDPAQTARSMFTVRAFFVAYCYVASHASKLEHETLTLNGCMEWIKKSLSEESPFLYMYEQTEENTNTLIDSYLHQIDKDSLSCNVGFVYESLLHTDVSESCVKDGDTSRNMQGSYYSPVELASYVTKSVIENFIENNGLDALTDARIIDFSCGSGIFLVESLRYIGEILQLSKAELSRLVVNLYACDVDFIALEICKFNIMDFIEDLGAYTCLSKHFRHANFLLDTDKDRDAEDKINAYLHGFIYHSDLAVGTDFLTEYDIILGNPPWEKVRFEEKSFYAQHVASIAYLNFKPDIQTAIATAEESNPLLADYCSRYKEQIANAKRIIRDSTRFEASCFGELNTSNLFTEAAYRLMSKRASVGLIIKSSTVATKASKPLFEKISNRVVSIIDFINKKKYFKIDGRERFTLLTMGSASHSSFSLAMNIQDIDCIKKCTVQITEKELRLLNPDTGMIPNLASSKDLPVLLSIYKSFKTIAELFPALKYGRLVHFTNHAADIDREKQPDNIPVYEGKFFSSFDGAYAGFNHVPISERYKAKAHARKLSEADRRNRCYPESRFFIKNKKWTALSASYHADYMLAWHSLTSATNERACVATILPFIPASQSVQFLTTDSFDELVYLCCLFNSVVFDYIVKNKLTGIDLTQSFIKQVAVPDMNVVKQQTVSYKGKRMSVLSILYTICHEILKEDERLNTLWKRGMETVNGLPTDRKSLLSLMDVLIAIIYQIPSDGFEYIFSAYSSYSTGDIKNMMGQVRQLSAVIKP